MTTYQVLNGKFKFVELSDSSIGEWIVYDEKVPRFHINLFRENSDSDIQIKRLIEMENLTIESIIQNINSKRSMNLNFGKRPLMEWIVKIEVKELDLRPIPIQWIIQY